MRLESAQVSRASSRVPGLDAARVLATFGVVWVHTSEIQGQSPGWATLGRFGTSFYALATIFLAARAHFRNPKVTTLEVAARRGRRLLVPYVLWCVIYAVFYLATMFPQGHPLDVITRYWGLLFGTAPHLWFLPFAFAAGVLASWCVPRLMRLPGGALFGVGLFFTSLSYVWVYGGGHTSLNQPWLISVRLHRLDRWVEEAPLVVGGIFGCALYGKYLKLIGRWGKKKRTWIARLCLGGFLATEIFYGLFIEQLDDVFFGRVRFLSHLAGAFWLTAFVAAHSGSWITRLAPWGRATYFAYLSHQLILDASKVALTAVPGHGTLWFAVVSSLGIFALAVALGLTVARFRLLRWLSP